MAKASQASMLSPLLNLPPYGWSAQSGQALEQLVSGKFGPAGTTAIESLTGTNQYLSNIFSFYF